MDHQEAIEEARSVFKGGRMLSDVLIDIGPAGTQESHPGVLGGLKRKAYEDGRREGIKAAQECKIEENSKYLKWTQDGDDRLLRRAIADEACLKEKTGRQYASRLTKELRRLGLPELNLREVLAKYDEGVPRGIREALEGRFEDAKDAFIESLTADEVASEYLRGESGIEVMDEVYPLQLEEFFPALSEKEAQKVEEAEEEEGPMAALRVLSGKLGRPESPLGKIKFYQTGPTFYRYTGYENKADVGRRDLFFMEGAEVWVLSSRASLMSKGDPRLYCRVG
jgi:hypothetical protein